MLPLSLLCYCQLGTQRFFIVRYPVLPISKTVFSILVSQTLKSYLLNLAVYFEYFGFVVYTRMKTKVEGKSTFRTVQGTDVCPVDYVNRLLFTVKIFLVWHLTFAQLLLYFMNKPACQCLEMQCFRTVHWGQVCSLTNSTKYMREKLVSGGIHFLLLDCRRVLRLVDWFVYQREFFLRYI